jgi:hypothetical protein
LNYLKLLILGFYFDGSEEPKLQDRSDAVFFFIPLAVCPIVGKPETLLSPI